MKERGWYARGGAATVALLHYVKSSGSRDDARLHRTRMRLSFWRGRVRLCFVPSRAQLRSTRRRAPIHVLTVDVTHPENNHGHTCAAWPQAIDLQYAFSAYNTSATSLTDFTQGFPTHPFRTFVQRRGQPTRIARATIRGAE